MTLEEIILSNSTAPISKLMTPATKAFNAPTTGITVQAPAAVPVIRDCAMMTMKYLPHHVFGLYANPFGSLKGTLTVDIIKDFVERSKNTIETYQLLRLIIDKGPAVISQSSTIVPVDSSDPYGEYGTTVNVEQTYHDDVYTLSKLFGVI